MLDYHVTDTICPYCGVGCTLSLHVHDNHIVKVTSPFEGSVNGGFLCVKGRFGLDFVDHPDRLTMPLVRKNGELIESTWDEALDLIAERMAAVTLESGPRALAFLASAKCTNEENYLKQKFARAVIGTNNVDHCARLCHSSTVTGLAAAFGSGAMTNSIADLREDAQAFLVIGSNTTEQHPVLANAVKYAVHKRGAKLIVADPREIELANFADIYLQHRPGSDIALLNALAYVILHEGLADSEYIQTRTENFDAWREVVKQYTPDHASAITGVPAEDIVAAARLFGSHRPGAILYAMGITQHTMGHQNVLAVANLGMVLGNIGVAGGGINPLRGQNNVQGACDMGGLPNVFSGYQRVTDPALREKMAEAWGVPVSMMDQEVGLTVTEMLSAAEAGEVRALWIMGENPVMSDPDSTHARHCLEHTEFLVHQDIFLNETGELADVVLPAAAFAEKDGTFTNTERRVQRVRQAVEPPGQALPDWQIICEVGRRTERALDRTPSAGWAFNSPSEVMDEIASLTPIYGGTLYHRLEDGGLQWPCPTAIHPGTPYLHRGEFSRGLGYFTPVHHQPAAEEPDDEYPLLLTTGRRLQHFHTGTMTRRVGGLDFLQPHEVLEMHPDDAAALGIVDGEWITVESRRGKVQVNAWVTDHIRPGVVFMTFHFAEALGNVLTNAALDPIAKIPEYKVCGVRVAAVEPVGAD